MHAMRNPLRPIMVFRLSAVLIGLLWLFGGCVKTTQVFDDLKAKLRLEADSKTLEKGYAALKKGQYPAAENLFQGISDSSGSQQIRRRALYGLAVARLGFPA